MIGLIAVAGVLGLLIGSFLNVVIHRVPDGQSVVTPRSACPHCAAPIRWFDNIPVVSWLVLRGRCRDCGGPIAVRYPLVELGTGAAFALVAWLLLPGVLGASGALQTTGAALALLAFLYLAAISIALALIDIERHRLPNALVLPAYLVGAVLLVPAALLLGEPGRLLTAGIGLLALGGFYLALALFRPDGMGMGDVKLAGVLGLFLGWLDLAPLVVGGFAAFLLGGVFGAVLLLVRRAGRRSRIPFGPWMLLGAWLGVVAGEPAAAWYLSFVGLR